jgi:hypothetical protein
MEDLKEAIKDQKYLFEPAAGLADCLPELESLHQHLWWELQQRHPKFFIEKTVSLPPSFAAFIRDNAHRFTRLESGTFSADNPMPPDFVATHMAKSQQRVQEVRNAFAKHAATGQPFDFQMMMSSVT